MIRTLYRPKRNGVPSKLWTARIRLGSWQRPRDFPLHVTDRRVAEQKRDQLIAQLEREEAGIGVPSQVLKTVQKSLPEILEEFITELKTLKRKPNTLIKYRGGLTDIFAVQKWTQLRDITAKSFTDWRRNCGLKPKSINDRLGTLRTFINWLIRRGILTNDPLVSVEKVQNLREVPYRRSISPTEMQSLLRVSPPHRSVVYLTAFYLGLRRNELRFLKWGDVNLEAKPPVLRVPATISKNGKSATLELRAELAEALYALKPNPARIDTIVFRKGIPQVPTLKRDLAKAGISFEDDRGSRFDLHSLRVTFVTHLFANGASPYAVMQLARHSDIKLTLGIYTDHAGLQHSKDLALLPSLKLGQG